MRWHAASGAQQRAATGVAATAISAVDVALWDLKAKLLAVAAALSAGQDARAVPVYGSGGFTTYDDAQAARPACRLGRARRLPLGEDEDRHRSRSVIRIAVGGSRRRRSATAATFRRRKRRLHRQAGAGDGGCLPKPGRRRGSRSRSRQRRLGWPCICCASACRPGSRSRPANMATNIDYLRRMLAGRGGGCAAGRRDTVRRRHRLPRRRRALRGAITSTCPGTVRPRCTVTWPVLCHGCGISSISTTMSGLERMLFDGAAKARDGAIVPDLTRPGIGLALKTADAEPVCAMTTTKRTALETILTELNCAAVGDRQPVGNDSGSTAVERGVRDACSIGVA